MKEPKLPRLSCDKQWKESLRRSKRRVVVVHWMDANFDSSGRIVNGHLQCAVGCPDATVGYYHGIENGCVVLSTSAYVSDSGGENHRHVWTIPLGMVVGIDTLVKKG